MSYGVSDVVDLLDHANIEAVIRDFGDTKPEEDPVIHFYELFLKEYDEQEADATRCLLHATARGVVTSCDQSTSC